MRVPTAAFFLLAAALASDVWPGAGDALSIRDVERIAVVALIVILFDGGMRVGWQRFRESAVPIVSLGLFGTFATAGLMTLAAHYLLDFSWQTAGLLGAALAPTDPAVMFSVFGRKGDRWPHRHDPRGRVGCERSSRDRVDARRREPCPV